MSRPATVDPLDVIVLAGKGRTAYEIADDLGCDRSWVYKIAKDCGVQFAAKGQHPKRTPDTIRARVDQLKTAGWSQVRIAREVGRSPSWVAMYLRGER